ncbi:MAG TPA: hypothetical protein IAC20_05915 [Candidatus Faecisoma merdavium]|nr:hypothetical protein [Candidatus Faecisoma merdavium]
MEKIFNFKITPIVLAIFVILLSVGYSAFQESMNITGSVLDVRVEADIRITGISVDSSTGNAISTYEEYNVKNISMGVTLPSSNSTVTYKIEVTNFGNVPMAIASINGLPYNLEYEIIDYNLKDKICDNNDKCTLGAKKEFYLKIKNKADQFNSSYTTHLLNLSFEFKPFYTVTYKNINNVHYPTSVLEGEDLNVKFDSETTINEIKMGNNVLSSNNYTFDGINLTIPDVSGDIVITLPPTLISTLLEQYSPNNTKGLVKDSTNPNLYYYTGTNEEVANNFFWYGGHQWRVLEFDTSENSVTLISQQPLTAIQPASSVWTTQSAYNSSYINQWLNDYFYNSLDSSIQSNIQKTTFNVGIYTNVGEIKTNQKVGLLDVDQYKRAGSTNSFLDIKDYFWLGNRYSSSRVRGVSGDGRLTSNSVSSTYGVRAVIKISDLTITGGDGTLASNYQVGTKATNTNNVQIGEYINVPYSGGDSACGSDNMCTFRVVSKDSDSIKVVLNGLLPTESSYGSSTTISTSHTIYTPLNAFAEGINDTYRYTGNKTFYIGDYPYVSGTGQNYEDVQDETLQASVGLPTVGEMFSGNDIDLSTSSTKIFVDVNTIENPTVSSYYWTMNRYSSSYVRYVHNYGYLNSISVTSTNGVRAVIYLKSGTSAITFTGGEGTAQSPYELPKTLIGTLLEQYNESNTTGLVKDSTNENLYYYTGTNEEVANNHLWYGGHHWRVLEFDTSAKTLTLITQQPLTAIQPASAVWATQSAYNSSYINQWLNDYFYNSLDSSIQSNIQKTTFNVGIYTNVGEIKTEQKVGLLDEEQYKRAGSANSFLDIKDYFWLGNRYSSFFVRSVSNTGKLNNSNRAAASGVRAVIKISDLTITEGDGTLASNYQVGNKATNINNVQVGEYINVPYNGSDNACGSDKMCTFRVVSKDSDSIKVVLNGLLPTESKWADSASDNITTKDLIYTNVLNGFIANIDSKYITTGTYGVGMYQNGNSYTVPQNTTITANIGLSTVGEMFSGNDIDLSISSTKTFVDVSTIENSTISNYYWTMNRNSSSNVRNVDNNGELRTGSPATVLGVRPVIYLKNNLELTGEGTAQSPYEIVPPPIESFSFAEDSWETIAKNIRNGKADEYYSVGDTKDVTLSGYGTFKVRIANLSRPESCTTWNYSQTACGFVIEFVDIITNHVSLVNGSTMYGWPQSELRRFLNEDIYSALPKDLQNIITDTHVVSGYDIYAENNYYSNDKLYLLSSVEIGNADDSDSVTDTSTRRLDYYTFYETSGASIRMKKYNGEVTRWWLRSPDKYNSSFYLFVNESGSVFNRHSLDDEYGLAPAFRIG